MGGKEIQPFIEEAHHRARNSFQLVDYPPRGELGLLCQVCINRCQIPLEAWGYCGLRTHKEG
jgi:hypothetical protein